MFSGVFRGQWEDAECISSSPLGAHLREQLHVLEHLERRQPWACAAHPCIPVQSLCLYKTEEARPRPSTRGDQSWQACGVINTGLAKYSSYYFLLLTKPAAWWFVSHLRNRERREVHSPTNMTDTLTWQMLEPEWHWGSNDLIRHTLFHQAIIYSMWFIQIWGRGAESHKATKQKPSLSHPIVLYTGHAWNRWGRGRRILSVLDCRERPWDVFNGGLGSKHMEIFFFPFLNTISRLQAFLKIVKWHCI